MNTVFVICQNIAKSVVNCASGWNNGKNMELTKSMNMILFESVWFKFLFIFIAESVKCKLIKMINNIIGIMLAVAP